MAATTARLGKSFVGAAGEPEHVLEEFVCAYRRRGMLLQGKMYITAQKVYFRSGLSPTLVVIPFNTITLIKKDLTLFVPNAITIHHADKLSFFGSFLHRERAFQVLNALRSSVGKDVTVEELLVEIEKIKGKKKDKTADPDSATSIGTELDDEAAPVKLDVGPEDPITEKVFSTELSAPPVDSGFFEDPTTHKLAKQIVDTTFRCTVRQFFQLFLSDTSPQSVNIHNRVGDLDLVSGPWVIDDAKSHFKRTLTFRTPVKSKLASGAANVTNDQRVRAVRGGLGLEYETSSLSTGVMYADTFTMESRWRIDESPDDHSTRLQIWLYCNWIRPPALIKGTIEKSAFAGASAMLETWPGVAKKQLSELPGGKDADEAAPEDAGDGASSNSSSLVPASAASSTRLRPIILFLMMWAVVLLLALLYLQLRISRLQTRYMWLTVGAEARV